MEIESFRALARYAPEALARLHPVLDQIELIDISPRVRVLAQTVGPVTIRSLDAIRLGKALALRRRAAVQLELLVDSCPARTLKS